MQNADTLVATLKVAAERFTYDVQTGAAVFNGWRLSLEECRAQPPATGVPTRQEIVKEMRVILDQATQPIDYPYLAARLAFALSSAPLERLLALQAAADMNQGPTPPDEWTPPALGHPPPSWPRVPRGDHSRPRNRTVCYRVRRLGSKLRSRLNTHTSQGSGAQG